MCPGIEGEMLSEEPSHPYSRDTAHELAMRRSLRHEQRPRVPYRVVNCNKRVWGMFGFGGALGRVCPIKCFRLFVPSNLRE